MNLPFEYEQRHRRRVRRHHPDHHRFRQRPRRHPSDSARSHDVLRAGTRNGPHEILVASSHMELWDEETETDVHSIGIFTLPEMEFPFATMDEVMARDSARGRRDRDPRQVSLRARRRALDHGAGRRRDRREASRACRCCRSTRTPICATRSWARRTTTPARCAACSSTRRRRRSASAACRRRKPPPRPTLPTDDLLRLQHAAATRTGSIASSIR